MPDNHTAESKPEQTITTNETLLRKALSAMQKELVSSPARTVSSYLAILGVFCGLLALAGQYIAAHATVFLVILFAVATRFFFLAMPCFVLLRDQMSPERPRKEFWFYLLISNLLVAPIAQRWTFGASLVPQSAVDTLRHVPGWVGTAVVVVDNILLVSGVVVASMELGRMRVQLANTRQALIETAKLLDKIIHGQHTINKEMLNVMRDLAKASRVERPALGDTNASADLSQSSGTKSP